MPLNWYYNVCRKSVMEATLEKQQKTNSPKLTCTVTGKVRPTNEKYLAQKAESRGVDLNQFIQYYACKQAVKRLRAGMSVEQVRNLSYTGRVFPIARKPLHFLDHY